MSKDKTKDKTKSKTNIKTIPWKRTLKRRNSSQHTKIFRSAKTNSLMARTTPTASARRPPTSAVGIASTVKDAGVVSNAKTADDVRGALNVFTVISATVANLVSIAMSALVARGAEGATSLQIASNARNARNAKNARPATGALGAQIAWDVDDATNARTARDAPDARRATSLIANCARLTPCVNATGAANHRPNKTRKRCG